MYRELDVVRLKVDLPDHGLKAGDEGTIMLLLTGPEAYEVEFLDADGKTLGLVGLKPKQIEPVSP